VLLAGGDYIQFLGLSSQQSFVFLPNGGLGTWNPSGPLTVPRELPGSVLLPNGKVLVAGGLTAEAVNAMRNCTTLPAKCTAAGVPDACCTAAGVGASCGPVAITTNFSAETFDPTTFMFTLTSGSSATPGAAGGMSAPRIATAELLTTGPDAGLGVLVGGASAFSASATGGPHTFPACTPITNIEQQSQTLVDLFDPSTTVFTADSVLNADRGGYGVGVGTFSAIHSGSVAASLVVIGGSCSEGSLASFPLGTAAAGATTGCNGGQYTSDYYELFNQGTGPGTGTWAVGKSAFPAGYNPAAAPGSALLP
jgi:hypothetical protein